MARPLRVLLAGEEAAGAQALRLLHESGQQVVGVLTGRGDEVSGPVASLARQWGDRVRPARLVRDPAFAAELAAEAVDLLLNVHSLHVARGEVVAEPRLGSFNVHPGPLPEYAGLNAPSWAILHGESSHAVTVHWMDAGIDTGDVAYEERFAIAPDETAFTLSAKGVRAALPLLRRLLDDAAADPPALPRRAQRAVPGRRYGREAPNGGRIDWSARAAEVERFVRASDYGLFVSPWGAPRATLPGVGAIEITKASTPIRAGTYATLASNFLTGETSIELLGGSDDGARLLPESIINWRPTTLMRLEDSLPSVLDELKKVVIDVHELFGSDNQARIAKLIDDVDAAVLELHARIEPMARDVSDVKERLALSSESIADSAAGLRRDVTASVDSGVTSLKAASKSIEAVTAKLSTVGDQLIAGTDGVDELVKSLRAAAARLDDALGGTDALVLDNSDELRRTIGALRQSSRELAALLAELKRDPSALLFSDKEPERTREAVADKPVRHGGGP